MLDALLIGLVLVDLALRVAMTPVILRRRFSPQRTLLWLLVVYMLPIPGTGLYFLLGRQYLGKRRREAYAKLVRERNGDACAKYADPEAPRAFSTAQDAVSRLAEAMSGNAVLSGNAGTYLDEAEDMRDRMIEAIDAAEHHVHLQSYIFVEDEIGGAVLDAAARAAQRGVTVRVIADGVGSRPLLDDANRRRWRQRGVDVRAAMPVGRLRRKLARFDLRNHRKLAVIDGRIGFAGSHNLVVQHYHDDDFPDRGTVDLSAECRGPIVGQLQRSFLDDWAFETGHQLHDDPAFFPELEPVGDDIGHVVPTGPTDESETFRRVLLAAVGVAMREVTITTPYLVPDEATMLALSIAAQRGVDVSLIVPGRLDKPLVAAASHAYYGRLLEAGIRIFRHRDLLLHSKTVTIDDQIALMGSANLDVRSFELNFELSILLYGEATTRRLRDVQRRYLDASDAVELEAWRGSRSTLRFYLERAAALFSPLL